MKALSLLLRVIVLGHQTGDWPLQCITGNQNTVTTEEFQGRYIGKLAKPLACYTTYAPSVCNHYV